MTLAGTFKKTKKGLMLDGQFARNAPRMPDENAFMMGPPKAALREGMKVELEHRDVTKGAIEKTARIAAAHICERRDYYKRLKKYVEK